MIDILTKMLKKNKKKRGYEAAIVQNGHHTSSSSNHNGIFTRHIQIKRGWYSPYFRFIIILQKKGLAQVARDL